MIEGTNSFATLSAATNFPKDAILHLYDENGNDVLNYTVPDNLKSLAISIPTEGDFTMKMNDKVLYWAEATDNSISRSNVFSLKTGEMKTFNNIRYYTDIADTTIVMPEETITYDGKAKTPAPVITYGAYTLQEGVDYKLMYSDNVNAGEGKLVIQGLGEYVSKKIVNFTINKASYSVGLTGMAKNQTSVAIDPIAIGNLSDSKLVIQYGYALTNNVANVSNWTTVTDTVRAGLSYSFTGLTANTNYYFFAKVTNAKNYKDYVTSGCMIQTNPKTIVTINADPKNTEYSGSANVGYENLTNDSNGSVGEADYVFTYTGVGDTHYESSQAPTHAGTYTVKISISHDSYAGATIIPFEITKKALELKANDMSVVYGSPFPSYTYTANGFVDGEDMDALSGKIAVEGNYIPESPVGNYVISLSNVTSNDYDITFIDGTLTVTKKPITLTWTNTSLIYDGTFIGPTATSSDLVGSDKITVNGYQKNPGSYTAEAYISDNYEISNKTESYNIAYLLSPGYVLEGTKEAGSDWYRSDVSVKPVNKSGEKNYAIASSIDGTYGTELTYTSSTSGVTKIYIQNALGQKTGPVDLEQIKIDKEKPLISFATEIDGSDKKITINGTDTQSGVKSVYYYLNTADILETDLATTLNESDWIKSTVVTITSDTNVYAKVVDLAGNVSYSKLNVTATIDCASLTIELPNETYTYNGTAFEPVPVVKNAGQVLTLGTDYTLAYNNNINAGTAEITICGKGEYYGTNTQSFIIQKATRYAALSGDAKDPNTVLIRPIVLADIADASLKIEYGYSKTNDSSKVSNWVEVSDSVKNGQSYEFTGLEAQSTYYFFAKVTNSTNYEEFTTAGKGIETKIKISVKITASAQNTVYSGKANAGYQSLSNNSGGAVTASNYIISYLGVGETAYSSTQAPIHVGTYEVTVTIDHEKYQGTVTIPFSIEKKSLEIKANSISIKYGVAIPNYTYQTDGFVEGEGITNLTGTLLLTGTYQVGDTVGEYGITPSGVTSNDYDITFTSGTLTVSYLDNPGYVLEGEKDEESGWYRSEVTVKSASADCQISLSDGAEYANSIEVTASGIVNVYMKDSSGQKTGAIELPMLLIDKEKPVIFFDVVSEEDKKTISITGEDLLSGIRSVEYAISDEDYSDDALGNISSLIWSPNEVVTIDSDCYLYAKATDMAGNNNYSKLNVSVLKNISIASVELPEETYTYNGNQIQPVPVLTVASNTLEPGIDYTASYENNINAGESAKITIIGKGKYYGKVELTFIIQKANRSITWTGKVLDSSKVEIQPFSYENSDDDNSCIQIGYSTTNTVGTVSNWVDVTENLKNQSVIVIDGLESDTIYYFFVKITNSLNYSDYISEGNEFHTEKVNEENISSDISDNSDSSNKKEETNSEEKPISSEENELSNTQNETESEEAAVQPVVAEETEVLGCLDKEPDNTETPRTGDTEQTKVRLYLLFIGVVLLGFVKLYSLKINK